MVKPEELTHIVISQQPIAPAAININFWILREPAFRDILKYFKLDVDIPRFRVTIDISNMPIGIAATQRDFIMATAKQNGFNANALTASQAKADIMR